MKKLINKLNQFIVNKKGETLVESLASLVIFSLLFATVVMIFQISLTTIKNSTESANEIQRKANQTVLKQSKQSETQYLVLQDGYNINVRIPVKLSENDAFVAFEPEVISAP